MRVIERFVRGKRPDPQLCEDVVVVTPDFAAVIDGATDKTDREFGGKCGGLFAAEKVAEGFENLPADIDLSECVTFLTTQLRNALATSANQLDIERDDGPSAVFVAYSAARREVWRVGDGFWRVGPAVFRSEKELDLVAAAMRTALLRALLIGGERPADLMRNDPGRQMILPLLRHQHRFRNGSDERFAYGAIDGTTIPGRFLESWSVTPGADLVLASDGYPAIYPTLQKTEEYLAADLRHDPMRIDRHWETKGLQPGNDSFDDRAYVRIAT